jgi:DNA-binding transcriptional LysR family regulator
MREEVLTMLDVRRLRLLRELQTRGTIAAVAAALAFTPSAVSQQLAQLQREAGVPLLERSGRGLRLTSAALQLVNHTEVILEQLERAEADLRSSAGRIHGILKVAAFQTAAISVLPNIFRSLAFAHQGLSIQLVEQDQTESIPALAIGELDVVIGNDYDHYPQPAYPGVVRDDLFYDPLLVALPSDHQLAASTTHSLDLRDLRSENWAAGRPGTGFGEVLPRACASLGGFHPNIVHRSNDFSVLAHLVAYGQALAFLPVLGWNMAPTTIVGRKVAEGNLGRRVFLATRRGSEGHPAIAAIRSAMSDFSTHMHTDPPRSTLSL